MLLDITRSVTLGHAPEVVWAIVRDPDTVADCIPVVRGFARRNDEGSFGATIEDSLGPFTVEVPISIEVAEDTSELWAKASFAGSDKRGHANIGGEVAARVVPADGGSSLEVTLRTEVVGRMAALGSVSMRRRAEQIFEDFVGNLSRLLGADGGG